MTKREFCTHQTMFTFRGRGGPSKGTPANVQCQKCLKRGHYSYECKASSQERPYVSRPSRSQQLRNPKLVPKLTEATPTATEQKKGTADQEIAKLEAERARKSELEDSDEDGDRSVMRQQRSRSASSESVSTISTRDSRSPPPRKETRSPSLRDRAPNYNYGGHGEIRNRQQIAGRSHSPPVRRRRSVSEDNRAMPRRSDRRYRERDDTRPFEHPTTENAPSRTRHFSSRSPAPRDSPPRSRDSTSGHRGHQFGPGRSRRQASVTAESPRGRSLSPFSRRLAMTREKDSADR